MVLDDADGQKEPQDGDGRSIDHSDPAYHEGLAYEHGQAHEKPGLSENATNVANYACDVKPPDFDNQCLVRMAEDPIARETIRCSVSGHFIDATVFRDTNILLEILQNAEPQDSKGSWFGFEFFAEGAWHPVVGEIDKFADDKIEALRISDNGKGYMPKDMTTLGGAKRGDPESAGRFGSGMKISDRSALGKNVQVTRSSRNWRAKPYLEAVLTSAGPDSTVSYNVEYVPNMHKGSVVEYKNPTAEMLSAARNIEAIYLPLDRTFRERLVAETDKGLLLKPKGEHGDIMVKGRKYTLTVAPQKPLLFSYDLQNVTIDDQNRHYVDAAKAEVNIVEIWNKVRDPKLFEELVKEANEGRECYELQMRGLENPPACFLEILKKELGVDKLELAYLADTLLDPKDAKVLERRGFKSADNKLARYPFFQETLKNIGVISGAELISSVTEEGYGSDISSENQDSFVSALCKAIVAFRGLEIPEGGEKLIVIVLEDKNGARSEMSYTDYLRTKPKGMNPVEMVCRLKSGYLKKNYLDYADWKHKEKELSDRDLYAQFEAFIKACSQVNVDVAIRNGHLEINPLNSRSYTRFKTRTWSAFPESDFELVVYLNNPTEQKQLEEITKFSLGMDENYKPVAQTAHGDVVKLEGGLIYEQGIRDESALEKVILSYNITAERDKEEGYRNIHQILSQVDNIEVARKILKKAKDTDRSEGFAEYGFIPANEAVRATWKKAFEEVFGAETALDDSGSYKADFKDPITTLADQSAIKKVRLHEKLSETLLACDVRKLSTAVEAKRTIEYSPNPIAEALLMVDKVADKAIEVSLPPGISVVKPEIRTAKTIYNEYGQVINGGFGYLDPLLRDKTIYVLDTVLQQSKIGNLLAFVLQKRVEVYRDQMSADEYIEFKAAVMSICERSVTSMDFLQKIRRVLFKKGKRIGELVERVLNEIPKQKAEKDQPFEVKAKTPKRRKSSFLPSFDKVKDAARRAVRPVAWIVATTACAAGLVVGGKFAVEKMQAAGYFQRSNEGSPDGGGNPAQRGKFNRGWKNGGGRSGVNVERTGLSRGGLSREEEVAERISFISVPGLSWGVFMNESPMNSYNGHGWSTDIDAPDFENPKFGNATRIAHMQKIEKGDKEVFLRPLSGGYIDPDSIELHKADGTDVKIKKLRPGPYGAYEVVLGEDDDVVAVSYHNLMPAKWMETAASLTDEDFQNLPRDAYEYHTQVPDLDLQNIRFSSEVFPEAKNLGEFVTHLQTLTPFERLALIRKVVTKMRYTITERTEAAFSDFHNGKLPEKDFLEFVMNSDRLENPGDGDCDVQNTVFAVIARYAGVPTKLDFVFTDKGVAHAPATVFLPKIGWVIMDSMGERKIIERVGRDGGISDNSRAARLDEDKAQQLLLKTLENRQKFEDLGCGNLQ